MLWKKRLAQLLVGQSDLSEKDVSDHHSCRLGKWYEGIGSAPYRRHPAFGRLDAPHARVHAAAREVVHLFRSGDRQAAMAEYLKLEQASQEVISGLNQLSAR